MNKTYTIEMNEIIAHIMAHLSKATIDDQIDIYKQVTGNDIKRQSMSYSFTVTEKIEG